MYHRHPFKDDPLAYQRGLALSKPFKTPTSAICRPRDQPTRKRKRVDYKENGVEDGDDGDKRSKRRKDESYTEPLSDDTPNVNKSFPVYDAKPSEEVFHKKFAIPSIKNKDGQVVSMSLSRVSLGIRPPIKLLPRPLHDPMADHAIVLYDPTIDDRETDEERLERLAEEAKEVARQEAAAKVVGMYNPHKSLRELLGENKTKKKVSQKVPVVIDPLLSKILRPHQVEGVKVILRLHLESRAFL
jgi:DNA repair and recombination protein RAD54 and RAD54-like protein